MTLLAKLIEKGFKHYWDQNDTDSTMRDKIGTANGEYLHNTVPSVPLSYSPGAVPGESPNNFVYYDGADGNNCWYSRATSAVLNGKNTASIMFAAKNMRTNTFGMPFVLGTGATATFQVNASDPSGRVTVYLWNAVSGQVSFQLPDGACEADSFDTILITVDGVNVKAYMNGDTTPIVNIAWAGSTFRVNDLWQIGTRQGSGLPARVDVCYLAVADVAVTAADFAILYTEQTGGAANTAPVIGTVTIDTDPITALTETINASVDTIMDAEQTVVDLIWILRKNGAPIQIITDEDVDISGGGPFSPSTPFTAAVWELTDTIEKSDSITVYLQAFDGTDTGAAESDASIVANTAPVVLPVDDQTIYENRTNVVITVTATDPDGGADIVGFSLPNIVAEAPNFNVESITLLAPDGLLRAAEILLKAGISDANAAPYEVTVEVEDADGVTHSRVMNVYVENNKPVVQAISNKSVQKGNAIEIPLVATDANGQRADFRANAEQLAISLGGVPIDVEDPPPGWDIVIVQDTDTTGRLIITIPVGGGNEVYQVAVRGKDGE